MKTFLLILIGACAALACMGLAAGVRRVVSRQAVEVGGMLGLAAGAALCVWYAVDNAMVVFAGIASMLP